MAPSTARIARTAHCSSSGCCIIVHVERTMVAAALMLVICSICSQQGAFALPTYGFLFKVPVEQPSSIFSDDNDCNLRPEVETLCQRCAKSTKSNVVYPMCCEDKEEAREWCDRYINFGIQ